MAGSVRNATSVLDLLPVQTADTTAAWMGKHPELEMVSHDRGGDYAAAPGEGLLKPRRSQITSKVEAVGGLPSADHVLFFV
jgi:hypothetical protein